MLNAKSANMADFAPSLHRHDARRQLRKQTQQPIMSDAMAQYVRLYHPNL
jgi:hypothetical protein